MPLNFLQMFEGSTFSPLDCTVSTLITELSPQPLQLDFLPVLLRWGLSNWGKMVPVASQCSPNEQCTLVSHIVPGLCAAVQTPLPLDCCHTNQQLPGIATPPFFSWFHWLASKNLPPTLLLSLIPSDQSPCDISHPTLSLAPLWKTLLSWALQVRRPSSHRDSQTPSVDLVSLIWSQRLLVNW